MMGAAPVHLYSVQFKDEAPAIGSGFRFVFVKQGHKWVYFLSPYTMRACKVRREVWDALGAVEVTAPDALARAREALQSGHHRDHTRLEQQALGGEG